MVLIFLTLKLVGSNCFFPGITCFELLLFQRFVLKSHQLISLIHLLIILAILTSAISYLTLVKVMEHFWLSIATCTNSYFISVHSKWTLLKRSQINSCFEICNQFFKIIYGKRRNFRNLKSGRPFFIWWIHTCTCYTTTCSLSFSAYCCNFKDSIL